MGSPEPIEGRCGARLRGEKVIGPDGKVTKPWSGLYCTAYPVKGRPTCRMHGGSLKGTGGWPSPSYEKRFERMAERGQAKLASALADPDLLDTKRPVALAQLIVEQVDLVPSRERAVELAKRAATAQGRDPAAVTEDDINDVYTKSLIQAGRLVELLGKRQEGAARQQRLADVLTKQVNPLMQEFALRLVEAVKHYVPIEKHGNLQADAQRIVLAMLGTLDEALERST